MNLSKSELALFFELTSDLMCILDEQGRCQQVNKAFEATLGYTNEAVRDRPFANFAHPTDRIAVAAAISNLLTTTATATSFICRYSCRPGQRQLDSGQPDKVCWLAWNVSAITHKNGVQRLYCVARDITPYKASEESANQRSELLEDQMARRTAQLSKAQEHYLELLAVERAAHAKAEQAKAEMELYAEVVQNMQVGLQVWRLEDIEDDYSLRLVAINPAASSLHGVVAVGVVGQKIAEAYPAVIGTDIPRMYADVVRNNLPHDAGEVLYGDPRVEPSAFAVQAFPLTDSCMGVAFENITERKQNEAVQREQADQLAVIFQQAGVGMARLSPQGQWIQVNQRLCDMLEYSIEALLQKTFAEITHPEDEAIDAAAYRRLVSRQKRQDSIEKRYITRTGKVVWAYVTISTVHDEAGELLYFIATIQDITQRKEATLALMRQKDDLLTVNRLLTDTMAVLEERNQELDQFAYVTSHDLKAPLRAIANLATWIEEDLADSGDGLPPENVEQFELLKSRVHRMEGLINGLLEYSRVGRKQQSREEVDVGKLLSEIIDSLSPPGEFSIEVASDMPVLSTRKVPLFQVFSNLINNAIKHHDRKDGRVQVSVQALDKCYEFTVADDGPGIDAKYHQKVFAIFQTLRARDELESTGIGLSIVKKTVGAEGGQISLESELGQGAIFRFTWPKSPRGVA